MKRTIMEITAEMRQELSCLRALAEDTLDIVANVEQLLKDEAMAAACAADLAKQTVAAIAVVGEAADGPKKKETAV